MSKTKLAVLDDYVNISQGHLQQFNTKLAVTYYPQTLNPNDPQEFEELVTRLQPYELISTMRERTPFRANLIERLPNLKVLFTTGPRNGGIDVSACNERGIVVVGTGLTVANPNYDTTNEQTWALILGLTKRIAEHDRIVKTNTNAWQEAGLNSSLAGKTLGLLGLGRLGLQCAITAQLGFGMNVVAWSSNLSQEKADGAILDRGLSSSSLSAGSVKVVSTKEELFRVADVVSVHLVLSDRSRDTVGEKELKLMKPSAIMVNTSRGPIVNEAELLDALEQGRIRGYAADVFDTEPLPGDSRWRSLKWGENGTSQVLLSPHMGYVTADVLHDMYRRTAENVQAWIDGRDFDIVIKP